MPLQLTLWETGDDYIVIDKEWNFCDLGYRQDMNSTILREQGILHWNGARKPWRSDGLYRDVWLPSVRLCCCDLHCSCGIGFRPSEFSAAIFIAVVAFGIGKSMIH